MKHALLMCFEIILDARMLGRSTFSYNISEYQLALSF